jgi:hypothetical protein
VVRLLLTKRTRLGEKRVEGVQRIAIFTDALDLAVDADAIEHPAIAVLKGFSPRKNPSPSTSMTAKARRTI